MTKSGRSGCSRRRPKDNAGTHQDLLKLYDSYRPPNMPFAALLDTTLESAKRPRLDCRSGRCVQAGCTVPADALASGFRILAELIDSDDPATRLRVGQVTSRLRHAHQQPHRLDLC